MDLRKALRERVCVYDGSKGVMLQRMGLKSGELGELWNVERPEQVEALHRAYRAAGSDVLQTNTFSANRAALTAHGAAGKLREINEAGVRLARRAADGAFVAASIGPTGKLMEPFGSLTFEEAYGIFAEEARILEEAGADAIHFETFMDLAELRAGILAAKAVTALPILATVALGENGSTLMGASAGVCALVCVAAGADAVGVNCSCGPAGLLAPVEEMARCTAAPLVVKPNAGLPVLVDGVSTYTQSPEEFASYTREFLARGTRLLGGCCGTAPEYMVALKRQLETAEPARPAVRSGTYLASASRFLDVTQPYSTAGIYAGDDPDDAVDDAQDAPEEADALVLDFGDGVAYDMQSFSANLCAMTRKPLLLRGDPESVNRFLRVYPGVAGVLGAGAGRLPYGAKGL